MYIISMTATNPHPLANPLNHGRYASYEFYNPKAKPFLNKTSDPKSLTVPDAKPYDPNIGRQPNLTVPNQDVPYFNGPIPATGPGFIKDSPLFKLMDGSVIDLKTHKIVYDPNKKFKAHRYWNDPNGRIDQPIGANDWGKTETIESLMAKVDNGDGTFADPNLDPDSIRYWKKANEESKKLAQTLTDEQKTLLDQLQSGQMFPLSKLVDEK